MSIVGQNSVCVSKYIEKGFLRSEPWFGKLILLGSLFLFIAHTPTPVYGNSKCSYCADYINKLECVEHCLRLLDQVPSAGTKRKFDVAKAKRNEAQLQLTLDQRKAFQSALNKAISWEKPLVADGMFGPVTRERLRTWERINLPGVKSGFYPATGYLDASKLSLVMNHVKIKERKADIAAEMARNKHDKRRNSPGSSTEDTLSGLWSWRYDLGKKGIDVGYILFNTNNRVVVYDYANDSSDKGGDCYKEMVFTKKPVSRKSYRYTHFNGKRMQSSAIYSFDVVGDSLTLTLNSDRSDLDGDGITDEKIVSVGKRASNINHLEFNNC